MKLRQAKKIADQYTNWQYGAMEYGHPLPVRKITLDRSSKRYGKWYKKYT